MEPLQGSEFFPNRQPRAALRLPWAMVLNRFAVEPIQWDRSENSPIVHTCFFVLLSALAIALACFIGGIAVQRWGAPRVTQDVDMTIP